MKYLLIFWLGTNTPMVATVSSGVACNAGREILEAQIKGGKGICLPTFGDEGNYARLLHDVNPQLPAD